MHMKVNIHTTGIDLSDPIEEHIYKMLSRVEAKLPDYKESIVYMVTVGRTTNHHTNGEVYKARIEAKMSGNDYISDATSDDLYKSIDIAGDELERSVVNNTKKKRTLFRRGASKAKRMIKGLFKK
jgi:ribosomal subunit interface protein